MKIRALRTAATCFAVVTSLFFLVCSAPMRAATNVSGAVGVATTWSAANAPYTVTGDVQVPAGSTLTIEPGVEVRYAGAYQIYVVGAVVANGTALAPIKFRSLTAGTSSGATMLKFEGANLNSTQLSYVQFSDANRAILVGGGGGEHNPGVACTGTLTVSNVTVTNAQVRTGGYNTTANLLLTNATVTNATIYGQYPRSEPIEVRDSTVTSSVITSESYNLGITLTNTAVSGGQILLGCCGANVTIKSGSTVASAAIAEVNDTGGGTLTINGATLTNTPINLPNTSCTIASSTLTFGSGVTPVVKFARGTVTGSTITGNGSGTGLEFASTPGNVSVTSTAISNFAVGLKFASGRTSGTLVVTGNQFSNNGTYNLEHRSALPIDALGNNWGTTDAYAIAQKIYDKNDDLNVGAVTIVNAAALSITTQPSPKIVALGGQAIFEVVVASTATPSYQWYKDGSPIALQTNSTLTLTGVQASAAGSYSVGVTSTAGSVMSLAVTLTVGSGPVSVQGIQSGNVVWPVALSPYTITGDVQVPAGSTLTIEPGVEVRYAGAYQIYVVGAVVANGTSVAPIKFRSLVAGTSSGATMLKFEGANLNSTQLSYVQFSDASRAILVGGGDGSGSASAYQGVACTGTLTVSNVTVTNAQVRTGGYSTAAKLLLTNATVTNASIFGQYPLSEPIEVRDSTVTNSVITSDDYNLGITLTNTAMSGGQIRLGCCGSSVTIKSGSTVTNAAISEFNNGGKLSIDGATLTNTTINLPTASCTIASSTITFGSGVPPVIKFAQGTITGSTITGSGSGTGLEFTDNPGNVTVTSTAISNFAVGLKFASGRTSGTLVVTGNQFSNNGTYNLENRSTLPIDGLGNNWGTTDAYAIAQKIYDKNDDLNVGAVTIVNAAALSITTQPSPKFVALGGQAIFEVVVASTVTPSFQWYKDGSPIALQTNSTLTLTGVQASAAGAYSVGVTSTSGSVMSQAATLTVGSGPINVQGIQSGNVVWSAALSPYTVTGDVQIPAGSTLTIEPGVEVRYAGAYQIYVVGAVVANGTSAAPIKFRSLTAGTSSGATMLKFEGANINNTQLNYVQFSDANRAILVGGGDGSGSASAYQGVACTGTLTVSNVTVTNAQVRTGGYSTAAKLLLTNATVTNASIFGQYPLSEPIEVRDSTVTNSVITSDDYNLGITLTNTAMSGGQIRLGCCGSSVTIKSGSTVTNAAISEFNNGGKLSIDGATLTNTTINLPTASCTIASSTITFGSGVTPVIKFAQGTVTGSTINGSGSGTGLEFSSNPGSVTVTGTAISNFAVGLKFAAGRTSGTLVVTGNQFSNNGTYNLEHRSALPIDGLGNNWGTSDAYAIAQKIYDKNDDINSGLVKLVDPALLAITSHPVNATVGVLNSTTFTVSATGSTALSYQWYKNGVQIDGATNPSLTLTQVQAQAAGTYGAVVSNSAGALGTNGATLTFVKGTVTVTLSDLTANYDGTAKTATASAPIVMTTPATLAIDLTYNGSATAPVDAGSYAVVATVNDANYAGTASGTLTIAKAPLTITVDLKTKVYGQANPAFTATLTGFVGGQTLATSGVTGSVAFQTAATSASAVDSYTVTPSVGTLAATNYAFTTFTAGALTVTKAPLTVVAEGKTRVYGSANPIFTATISGFVNGQTLATSGVTGAAALGTTATAASPVNTYPITVAAGSLASANYSFNGFTSGTLTITKAPLTVVAEDATRGYGSANPTFAATISGFVNGETLATSGVTGAAALSSTATSASVVDSYPITVAVGTLAAANYSFTGFTPGTLTITKAPLTVAADAKSKVYGSANPALTVTISGFVNDQTLATSGVTGVAVLSTEATTTSAAGTYPIVTSLGTLTASNYAFVSLVDGVLTVDKALLTVAADNLTRGYGTTNPTLTATVAGFVPGETLASATTGAPVLSTAATPASGRGEYAILIALGTFAAPNYTISFVEGTLTITRAVLLVTAEAKSKVYGEAVPTFTAAITGFLLSDTAAGAVTGQPVLTSDVRASSAVGSYVITPTLGTLMAQNYSFAFTDGAIAVTKAPLTVIADSKTKTYGETTPVLTATITGFVNGESLATSGVTGAASLHTTGTTASPVGDYPITVTAGNLAAANYAFTTTVSGTLTIAPRSVIVALGNLSQVYDGTAKSATVTLSAAGAPVSVTYNGVASPPVAAGSYLVNVIVVGPNHMGAATATLVIAKATQSVTFRPVPTAVTVGSTFSIDATASSGLPVVIAIVSGTATLSGNTVRVLDGSPFTLRATQAGDGNFEAATAELTLAGTKSNQTIAFAPPSGPVRAGATLSLEASATSGLPVAFSIVSGPARISNGSVVFQSSGTAVVRASQPGNAVFNAAEPVDRSFVIEARDAKPVIFKQPSPQSAVVGGSAVFAVVATGTPAPAYQWRKNGTPILGAAGDTLGLSNVQSEDAASYDVVVSNTGGSVTSSVARLTVSTAPTAPVITRQPGGATGVAGRSLTLSISATGAPAPTYQWSKDGAEIPGATDAVLSIASLTREHAGAYSAVARNTAGTATSIPATVKVLLKSYAGVYFGTLGNGGTFALYIGEDNTGVFLGFAPGSGAAYISRGVTISDDGTFSFTSVGATNVAIVEAAGTARPATAAAVVELSFSGTISDSGSLTGMASIGVSLAASKSASTGAIASGAGFYQAATAGGSDQALAIVSPSGQAMVLTQTGNVVDGGSGTMDTSGNLVITTAGRQTIALSVVADDSTLTATVTDATGKSMQFTGVAQNSAAAAGLRFVNLSARTTVGVAEQAAIVGFVVSGLEAKTVLIRAIGPALRGFGIGSPVEAPRLELFREAQLVTRNTGWSTSGNAAEIAAVAQRSGAFALPAGSGDSVILTTLSPGAYTAVTSAADGRTGVGLVEIYDLSGDSASQRLFNLSTRALVGVGDNTLITGFVISGTAPKRVLVRAAGPALAQFGVSGTVARPRIALMSGAGIVAQNAGWSGSADAAAIATAASAVGAFPFANGSADAAVIISLQPGAYTVNISDASGASGVALVELYELP